MHDSLPSLLDLSKKQIRSPLHAPRMAYQR